MLLFPPSLSPGSSSINRRSSSTSVTTIQFRTSWSTWWCILLCILGVAARVVSAADVDAAAAAASARYDPTWESLDRRPLPEWYDDAKVGIFIHWGVFSVPSFGSAWFWYYWNDGKGEPNDYTDFVTATERPHFAYPDYAHRFDATFYDPDYWATVFAQSGAQYVVLTSKHHEGFNIWDSRTIGTTWNWNSMDVGPRRDLVGELASALRNPSVKSAQTMKPLKFGIYHSLFEWFNPLLEDDIKANLTTQHFVDTKTMPELYQLVERYGPEIIWSDGDWVGDSDYWKSRQFLAWLATNSSVRDTVVWNDRWGSDANCKHGSFFNCQDRYLPNHTIEHKWENAMTVDKYRWGWNRNARLADFLTTKELIDALVQTVARNGNILINVGPAADGTISPVMVDRLAGLGDWLLVNGQAVYGTKPWKVCDQDRNSDVYYTRDKDLLYAHLTKWPSDNQVPLYCPQFSNDTQLFILGLQGAAAADGKSVELSPPRSEEASAPSSSSRSLQDAFTVVLPYLNPAMIPCQHVWVIAMTAIKNLDDDIVKSRKNGR
jgi:alpha-L-fucosidase